MSHLTYRQLEKKNEELESQLAEAESKVTQVEEALKETQKLSDNFATESHLDKIKTARQYKRDKRQSKEAIQNLNEKLRQKNDDLDKIFTTIKSVQTRFLSQNEQRNVEGKKEGILDMVGQISSHLEAKEEELLDDSLRIDNATRMLKKERENSKSALSKKESSIKVLSLENSQLREEKFNMNKTCKDLELKCVELQKEADSAKQKLASFRDNILKMIGVFPSGKGEGDHKRKRDEDDDAKVEDESARKQIRRIQKRPQGVSCASSPAAPSLSRSSSVMSLVEQAH